GEVLLDLTDDAGSIGFYSPDGRRLAIHKAGDGALKLLDAATGQPLLLPIQVGLPFESAFTPDGARLVTAGPTNVLKVWDATTGEALLSIVTPGPPYALVLSPADTHAAAGDAAGIVRIWDISPEGSREQLTLAPVTDPV